MKLNPCLSLVSDVELDYVYARGYLAPEYASYGQLSDKVDVYSFGVLCLEIVGGRRNIHENYPPSKMYLSR
jgi:hypothetical protein